jgi:putative hydrolase of the HAD superfamily
VTVQLTGIRTIVFDLDDTLYAERQFAWSGFDAVGEWLKGQRPCRFDPAARMKELFETEYRRRVFNQVLAELGCPNVDTWVPAMVEYYRNHTPAISLLPDAERALQRWSGVFFTAVISDGPLVMQEHKVEALGLRTRLGEVVLTDRWGREFWKPHPRAFEFVEQQSGRSGPACVYIADNPAKDFLAPNARGWRTIRICRPHCIYGEIPPPPNGCEEFEISSLDQVDFSF